MQFKTALYRFIALISLVLMSAALSGLPEAADQTEQGLIPAGMDRPHLMPPHPTIMEQVRQGKVTLPEYMLNPAKAAQSGVDQPNSQMPAGPTGTWRTLAILVKFSDKNSTVTASFFDSLLFGTSFKQLNHYYDTVSYGQLDIVTVNLPGSIGWKQMPQTYAYYVDGKYCTDGTYPHNCRKLAEDAVAAADAVVDFSQYDNDGNGYVDTVFIIHAGRGAEMTGSVNDVWSHSWWTYNMPYVDGVYVGSYTTEPEYWSSVSSSTSDMTIGVYAHELGHAFGLPDFYDTDYSSEGIGRWSLMSGGSWNGNLGDSPAFLDAWSRAKLGWVAPTNVAGLLPGTSIRNAETYQDVYKLKSSLLGANEYFLVENRQLTSYDAGLPGSGLLIWHVDDAKSNNKSECLQHNNWSCGSSHFWVALEQADGLLELENDPNSWADSDNGDPFPGSSTKRTFNNTSTPNSSSYYYTSSADTKLYVANISNSASTMTADLYVAAAPGAFNKTSPANGATGVSTSPTLTWGSSSGAVSYEYCIDTSAGTTCDTSWVSTGSAISKALSGLSSNTTYYWQVRARVDTYYTYANSSTWWSFTTLYAPPGTFNKSSPANNAVDQSTSVTLTWNASSGATSYEYCIDTVNDSNCTSPAAWTTVGNTTQVALSRLDFTTAYYWHVRARNSSGTTDASGGWWKFTTMVPKRIYIPLVLR